MQFDPSSLSWIVFIHQVQYITSFEAVFPFSELWDAHDCLEEVRSVYIAIVIIILALEKGAKVFNLAYTYDSSNVIFYFFYSQTSSLLRSCLSLIFLFLLSRCAALQLLGLLHDISDHDHILIILTHSSHEAL